MWISPYPDTFQRRWKRRRFGRRILAVLLFLLGLAIAGALVFVAYYNAEHGDYYHVTVTSTWTAHDCTTTGEGTGCRSVRKASVTYIDKDGQEQIATVNGRYEVGEERRMFIGPLNAAPSQLTAHLGLILPGAIISIICITRAIRTWRGARQ